MKISETFGFTFAIILGLALWLIGWLIQGLILEFAWNLVMPALFGLATIGLLQSLAIIFILNLIGGAFFFNSRG